MTFPVAAESTQWQVSEGATVTEGRRQCSMAQRMHFHLEMFTQLVAGILLRHPQWPCLLRFTPLCHSSLSVCWTQWLASSILFLVGILSYPLTWSLWWSQLPYREGALGKLTWQRSKGGLGPEASEELRPQYNRLWRNEPSQQPPQWAGKWMSPWLGLQMRPRDI